MKLLCDEMLSRLGRWLRAAGYDTDIAAPGSEDAALLRRSAAEGRLLLTRDSHLAGHPGPDGTVLLLAADGVDAQAHELRRRLGIDWLRAPFSRCVVDNAVLRLGRGLKSDYGAPRIGSNLTGTEFFKPQRTWVFYGFAGVEARLVGRNIFLDGNSFTDSHSVDRELLVGDLQVGFVLAREALRFTFTYVYRTQEFEGQDDPDRFGAFSLSTNF